MIVLRTPKVWTGPALVDRVPVEGTWRAHQVQLAEVRTNPGHLAQLEEWMRSYKPDELFDPMARLRADLRGPSTVWCAADERQPAHQRRDVAAGPAAAPTSATTPSTSPSSPPGSARPPAWPGSSCATWCAPTRARSAS